MWQILIAVALVSGVVASSYNLSSYNASSFRDEIETLVSGIEANAINASSFNVSTYNANSYVGYSYQDMGETCNMSTPYPVFEYSKVYPEFLASIPQEFCDEAPVEEIVKFNCMTT